MRIEKLKIYLLFCLFTYSFVIISCSKHKQEIVTNPNTKKIKPITKGGFSIDGKIASNNEAYVYLLNTKKECIDSVKTKNNEFYFHGKVIIPESYYLNFNKNSTSFILENTNFNVLLDSLSGKLTGGKLHTIYETFRKKNTELAKEQLQLYTNFNRKDINLNNYLNEVNKLYKIQKKSVQEFILNNQDNLLSKKVVAENHFKAKEIEMLLNKIDTIKHVSFFTHLKSIHKELELTEAKNKILRRAPTPLFSGVNLYGRRSSIEKLMKGKKAFLIDFWASWCPPCRKSSPKLIKLYNKYARKGLGVLTVSEDRSVNEWRNGVYEDGIEIWSHIYDDYNRISNMFNVGALPHLVLIDEDGKIIKNKISIADLEIELEKIFNP